MPRADAELKARVAASGHRKGEVIERRYQLLRPLSAGGAGVVWVARDQQLELDVAVKILDSHDPDSVRRMGLEAQAAARLQHPAMVPVYHFGTAERGHCYLVMELLYGESFASLLARERRIVATAAVRILLPVIDVLHVAHLQGIVHRDLKPANIFIARGSGRHLQPKVLDFGSARLIRSGPPLTAAGMAVGTPPYMSPEQITGRRAIDHRTDIWSLCVILYRAIAGRRPFAGRDFPALVFAIAHDEPTPLTEFSAGAAALWPVIQRGLEKSPRQRYASMFELGRALAEWLNAQGMDQDTTGALLASNWLEPQGPRRELANHRPSIMPKVGEDELEAPYRLRFQELAQRQASRPQPSRLRGLKWALVGLALLIAAAAYLFWPAARRPGEVPPLVVSAPGSSPALTVTPLSAATPAASAPAEPSPSASTPAPSSVTPGADREPTAQESGGSGSAGARRRRLRGTFGF